VVCRMTLKELFWSGVVLALAGVVMLLAVEAM
jgi:hypothetical protein